MGTWREDYRIAVLDSLFVNIVNVLYTKKGHKPVITTPMTFMPNWDQETKDEVKKMTTEDMKQIMMSIANVQNKKIGISPNTPKPKRRKK